jgi:nucleotide-binding universal stress UspA family protein
MLAIQTVLHPTDFSVCSEYAFRLACSLARDCGARVVVLHVLAPPAAVHGRGMPASPLEGPKERLRERLLRLEARDPEVWVEHQLVEGDPATQILSIAEATKPDLIVMGTRGWTERDSLVIGSVAEQVVRRAHCPVVTVKSSVPDTSSSETAGRPASAWT